VEEGENKETRMNRHDEVKWKEIKKKKIEITRKIVMSGKRRRKNANREKTEYTFLYERNFRKKMRTKKKKN
jgi:hypothetical protein